jgi:hypothetical protein
MQWLNFWSFNSSGVPEEKNPFIADHFGQILKRKNIILLCQSTNNLNYCIHFWSCSLGLTSHPVVAGDVARCLCVVGEAAGRGEEGRILTRNLCHLGQRLVSRPFTVHCATLQT